MSKALINFVSTVSLYFQRLMTKTLSKQAPERKVLECIVIYTRDNKKQIIIL